MMLFSVDSLFEGTMKYITSLIIATVIVLFLVLLYLFVIKRSNRRKAIRDLEKRYSDIHDHLTGNVEQSINRINFISQKNMVYVQLHEQFVKEYDDILQNQDKSTYIAITQLKSLVLEKKYHGIKSIIDSCKTTLSEFSKRVSSLDERLVKILQKDEECRQQAVTLQRQYREVKEKYSEYLIELKLVEKSFEKIFEKIDRYFQEFEDLSNSAQYEESEEKLPTISKVLTALDEALVDLPSLCTLANTVLPNRIDELGKRYQEMEKEHYPLHHLKVNLAIEEFNNDLESIKTRLSNFQLDGIKEESDQIEDRIIAFFRAFEVEKEAKVFFNQNCEEIYNSTYNLEKHFLKLKRMIPGFKDIYVIKANYLEDLEAVQNDINNLGNIKRDLDTYIHSSTKQPYSILVRKLHDLQEERTRINEVINDFQKYLTSLKKDSEYAFKYISTKFVALKKAQALLREIGVSSYKETLVIRFEKAYYYLDTIGELIKSKPLDVQAINDNLAIVVEIIAPLIKEVEEQSSQRKYAEDSIVYANQYRQEFYDVRQVLARAERSFNEGDFTRTIDETVKIIKKMRPDVIS